MKPVFTLILFFTCIHFVNGQVKQDTLINKKYYRLIEGSEKSDFKRIELSSDIDTTWNKWKLQGYNYGFDSKITPMHTSVNGILSTPYMIQVRENENEKNKNVGVIMFLKVMLKTINQE